MPEFDATKTFSVIDYIVFGCTLLISSAVGVFYAWKDRKVNSNDEFLTSRRGLHWFPVALSLMASFQSSVTILGYPAEMYLRGTQIWIILLSAVLAAVTAAELFLPVYYGLEFTSVNKYLSLRYKSENIRLAASITFLCSTLPYMGVTLYGPSLALSSVTNLSVEASILIIGLICTFYTSIGGIKAVVWTDTIQVFLMFGGLIAVMVRVSALTASIDFISMFVFIDSFAQGFYLVGGIGEAFSIADRAGRIQFTNIEFNPYATNNLWNAFIGMGVMWCGNYCTTQTEVQRYCNVVSKKKAKLAIYVNLVGVCSIISIACLCGIAVFAYYNHCDPLKLKLIERSDQLMPFFVMQTLSDFKGVPGLFVSCVFSASLSTLSSGFNALAAITWDDFLSRTNVKKLSASSTSILGKIIAASYGLLAIGMAFLVGQVGSVLQAAISISGALVGPMLGMYLLGITCPFANAKGVITGLVSGGAFALWILFGSMIYPPHPTQMPTFIDKCPLPLNFSMVATTVSPVNSLLKFVITFCANAGGLKEAQDVNPKYLSVVAWKLWPSSWVPLRKPGEASHLLGTLLVSYRKEQSKKL
ncbi:sodium-coupled monocarboxylate transporter 1-like protein 1 [Dinothrombium tinctorium]|uniref:Sodium-coupled monocarboxylate transporter 1-like protein 1 n=1 Tax=Dinothrombium tinctorium TaxID=1965070 RepID=A0A443QXF2_9ACAR|nr:sodium-coupled monocarboxylate transporter 1-like protein 1 [Dinothrombium tinctorium]